MLLYPFLTAFCFEQKSPTAVTYAGSDQSHSLRSPCLGHLPQTSELFFFFPLALRNAITTS